MKFKRLVAVGDAHAGHRVGLASPQFQSAIPGEQFYRIQVELWDYFQFHINELKKEHPIDILVHNGDAIDGPGGRSGGSELITTDCNRQIDIAYDALKIADAGNYFFTYGTAYHTGQDTDYEKVLADRFNGIIRSHLWLDVNGTTFDIKHHIGNSSVPHGKGTPIAKEWLWNTLWNLEQEQQPKADVYIRCLSSDTEVLTSKGWRGCDKVKAGSRVMTLNMETNTLEWNIVSKKTKQSADKEMVSIKAKGYDVLVTKDHTMYYKKSHSDILNKGCAIDLLGQGLFKVPVSGHFPNPGLPLKDSFIKLMAWIIAEGSIDVNGKYINVRLFQNESGAHEVESVLMESGIPYTKRFRKQAGSEIKEDSGKTYYTKEDGVVFYLKQPFSAWLGRMLNCEKMIPDWLMAMDNRQFNIFLEEYIKGDGHLDDKGDGSLQGKIFTANKSLADKLQILLVTNGYKAQISEREKWDKISYVVGFCPKTEIYISNHREGSVNVVPYSGYTWCVTVPNGTIMTRRNGKVAVIGNSHVHNFALSGGADWLGMTLPALQGQGSKYGARRCSQIVHFGLVWFDCYEDGSYIWSKRLLVLESQKQIAIKV